MALSLIEKRALNKLLKMLMQENGWTENALLSDVGDIIGSLEDGSGIAEEGIGAAQLDPAAQVFLPGVGADASLAPAPATCTGADVGNKVVAVLKLDTGVFSNVSAHFESVITIADQIQQSAEDLGSDNLLVILLATAA